MLFRPRYGRIGCFAFPYLWLFELFAPVVEIGGIITIVLAACLGVLSREFFLQFLIFGYAFATVISIGSVLQEEITGNCICSGGCGDSGNTCAETWSGNP
jgi:hypothetical protein